MIVRLFIFIEFVTKCHEWLRISNCYGNVYTTIVHRLLTPEIRFVSGYQLRYNYLAPPISLYFGGLSHSDKCTSIASLIVHF